MNHWQPEVGGYGPGGGFSFNGGLTARRGATAPNRFNSYADFLLGLPGDMGKSREEFGVMSTRGWGEAFYIRDQWQATRNLTINYGFLWEYYPIATRDQPRLVHYDPPTHNILF